MNLRETTKGRSSNVWSYQAQLRTSWSAHLGGVYSFGQKRLSPISNFTTSRKALGWWITLGATALFQRIGMRFLAAKVFFKSHCFLWLPPSRKWLCCGEWPIQGQCNTLPLQLHKPHLNFSDFRLFCTVFPRASDGGSNSVPRCIATLGLTLHTIE